MLTQLQQGLHIPKVNSHISIFKTFKRPPEPANGRLHP